MTENTVLQIAQQAMVVTAQLAAPVLLTGLVIGLVVSMIQAATSIQEMTLTFIPKMIGVGLAVALAGQWMLRLWVDFTERLYNSIPNLVG